VTTGNEVRACGDQPPTPWQLRDSNRASILTLLEAIPWIQIIRAEHCPDDQASLTELLRSSIADSDALLLTGGVSMGDYDFVPAVLRAIGGEVVFHGLPIRPGKPILGAVTREGKLLMGLPGNPVSALVGCHRMANPLLRKIAGVDPWMPLRPLVYLNQPDQQKIPLHWMRLVRLADHGMAELVDSHGSGDLVSLGHSSGFIELPPGSSGSGPWPYTAWA
jgi:molybdopterin molybdotransferase